MFKLEVVGEDSSVDNVEFIGTVSDNIEVEGGGIGLEVSWAGKNLEFSVGCYFQLICVDICWYAVKLFWESIKAFTTMCIKINIMYPKISGGFGGILFLYILWKRKR
jgi:hypothetical protein